MCRHGLSLDYFDHVSRNPDIDLAEAIFPNRFHCPKEISCRGVAGVNAQAEELVALTGAAVLPSTRNADRVLRDTAKLVAEFVGRPSASMLAPSL
jgi:hypothetical protein